MDDGYQQDSSRVSFTDDPRKRVVRGYIAGSRPRLNYRMPVISEITGGLWMGGVEPGLVLPEFITNVVSLHPYGGYKTKHHLDSHLIFRMEDDAQQDLGDVIDIAKWVFNRPSATLVHCHMGLNRSGLITAMVLRLAGYTPEEAISTLREERSPAVLCNSVFEKFILHSQLT